MSPINISIFHLFSTDLTDLPPANYEFLHDFQPAKHKSKYFGLLGGTTVCVAEWVGEVARLLASPHHESGGTRFKSRGRTANQALNSSVVHKVMAVSHSEVIAVFRGRKVRLAAGGIIK
jgi:hypothetical protein